MLGCILAKKTAKDNCISLKIGRFNARSVPNLQFFKHGEVKAPCLGANRRSESRHTPRAANSRRMGRHRPCAAWLPRPAAVRDCVPPAAAPM